MLEHADGAAVWCKLQGFTHGQHLCCHATPLINMNSWYLASAWWAIQQEGLRRLPDAVEPASGIHIGQVSCVGCLQDTSNRWPTGLQLARTQTYSSCMRCCAVCKPVSPTSSQIWVLQRQEDCFFNLLLHVPARKQQIVLCASQMQWLRRHLHPCLSPASADFCKPCCCACTHCSTNSIQQSDAQHLSTAASCSCKHSLQSHNIVQ